MKRPHFHLWPLEQFKAGPASGPQALSDAILIGGLVEAAAPPGAMRGAREGTPRVLGGSRPPGEVGVPKTPLAAEAREKAFSLNLSSTKQNLQRQLIATARIPKTTVRHPLAHLVVIFGFYRSVGYFHINSDLSHTG